MRIRKDPGPWFPLRVRAGRPIAILFALAAASAAAPDSAGAQACSQSPPDPSICPANMPPASALAPVFLIGSASGGGYYDDCGLVDQLAACGWPRERVFPVYREADPEDLLVGARAMFEEVESIRAALGAERIDLVGYSLGGPRIWAYLTQLEGWRHARHVVLWASPNFGLTYTPYIRVGRRNVVLPWHRDVTEGSPFQVCAEGRSTDPACANPFAKFPPRAIPAAEAASGAEGTVYYNLYSADYPCETCTCRIWCDAPGENQEAAHRESDLFVAAENTRLARTYNIEIELVAHWDFIEGDARRYSTGLDWFERYGTPRPRRNDVWAETMAALLGRDPTSGPGGEPPACARPHVRAAYGLEAPADACAPARCGTVARGDASARDLAAAGTPIVGALGALGFVRVTRRLRARALL